MSALLRLPSLEWGPRNLYFKCAGCFRCHHSWPGNGTFCSGQLPRPLVALVLQDLRTHLKVQGYHFTPFIFFPLGFSFSRSSGQIFKRNKWLAPLARDFLESFQSRLSLYSSWESKKGELSRIHMGLAAVQATVDRSWGSPPSSHCTFLLSHSFSPAMELLFFFCPPSFNSKCKQRSSEKQHLLNQEDYNINGKLSQ